MRGAKQRGDSGEQSEKLEQGPESPAELPGQHGFAGLRQHAG